ncbi:TadE family type IV pilus minor pilin [Streptomyces sp. NPDC003720]|uniref:TadE family type IV pilus minor pilin n=1 Tax=Streptomyces sp. NPDC003720 TaxID=3364684 RepID=UPI0036C1D2B9
MTAESAVVLSVLVAFTMALVWGLLVVAAQIQCVDAARAGARAAARQDPADAVVEVARQAAPRGARVTVGRAGDQVRVTVVARPPVLSGLPFEVREEAVAAAEETVGAGAQPGTDTGTGPGTGAGAGSAAGAGESRGADTGTATGAAVGAGIGAGAVAGVAAEPGS